MPRAGNLLIETTGGITVATFTEASVIDLQHIDNIRADLLELIEQRGLTRILLQLSKVHHFSSSAIGMLVELGAAVKKSKGQLVLCGVRPEIRKLFKITKLERKFKFAETEKVAFAILRAGK